MDYKIFNVRTYVIILARAYTHGLGTPTMSRRNVFDSEKLFGSWVRHSTNWGNLSQNQVLDKFVFNRVENVYGC